MYSENFLPTMSLSSGGISLNCFLKSSLLDLYVGLSIWKKKPTELNTSRTYEPSHNKTKMFEYRKTKTQSSFHYCLCFHYTVKIL